MQNVFVFKDSLYLILLSLCLCWCVTDMTHGRQYYDRGGPNIKYPSQPLLLITTGLHSQLRTTVLNTGNFNVF